MYLVRTPFWVKYLYPAITWRFPSHSKCVYLTFDDGPHPEITPWVLDQLDAVKAKATFFCSGQQAELYPDLVQDMVDRGHAIGNHGYVHLNGWNTPLQEYVANAHKAAQLLNTNLFRPPYGRITRAQLKALTPSYRIINWSLMPGDFDAALGADACLYNLLKAKPGDIVVLHDSEQAWKNLQSILPRFLLASHTFHLDKIG